MAISGADEIVKQISSQISSQFPGFIREDGEQFVAFMRAYAEFMEQSDGGATYLTRSIKDNRDIDRTVSAFIDHFRREYLVNIPADALASQPALIKHIRDFYRSRGSQQSYRFLFRALFDKELDFYYPGDDILRASDGRWIKETKLRVSGPMNIDPYILEGNEIEGLRSGAKATVQGVLSFNTAGIKTWELTLENIRGIFLDEERVISPQGKYATIFSSVGGLVDFNVVDGGAGHQNGDLIRISGAQSTAAATAYVTKTTDRSAATARIVNKGSGFTKLNTVIEITGGSGQGLELTVSSYNQVNLGVTINNDSIALLANVAIGANSFFVRGGANTSTVKGKLTGTVKLFNGSNTVIGQGSAFNAELTVGDVVRVTGVANTLRVHSISSAQTFVTAIAPIVDQAESNAYYGIAAANAYSTLASSLLFTNTFYSINSLAIINPGYGYTTLPNIRIYDSEISTYNYDDGYGGIYGNNAIIVSNNTTGAIESIALSYPGENFNNFLTATIRNATQGNGVIGVTTTGLYPNSQSVNVYKNTKQNFQASGLGKASGVITYPGKYIDTKGFLSWNNKLQDNYYYQEFSYVVRVSEALEKYKEVIRRVLHPAGTKMFADYIIESSVDLPINVVQTGSNILNDIVSEDAVAIDSTLFEITTALPTESASLSDSLGVSVTIPTSESITVAAVQSTQVNFSAAATESITSTETTSALAVFYADETGAYVSLDDTITTQAEFASFANEQFTTSETQSAQLVANPSITESATSTSVQTGERFVLMSGYYQVQYANSQIQAYQTAQIQPYAFLTAGSFDGTARLVTNTTSGSFFSNGAINANNGTISVGGPGSNLFIVSVGDSLDPTTIYQVNTIFSNTALTLRTEYLPVTSNAQIYYSTGPG